MGHCTNAANLAARNARPSFPRPSFHRLLLGSVSALACGIVLAGTPSAHAQQVPTSTNNTVETNGTSIIVNQNVNLTGHPAVVNNQDTGFITNQGAISGPSAGLQNSAVLGTLSNAGLISGYTEAIYNGDNIGTLSNTGTVISAGSGVENFDFIGTLTNSGLIQSTSRNKAINNKNTATIDLVTISTGGRIAGNQTGIDNAGLITALTNAGTITGHTVGLRSSGFTGTLTNAGLIASNYGIYIGNGTVATLANTGIIAGTFVGIDNGGGFIGQLSNATNATISGRTFGVMNGPGQSLAMLTNAGTITGGELGILNQGSISNITNTGIIGGATPTAISNAGSIGTLTNSGVISGTSVGIANTGSIGTLANTAQGTISGGSTGILNVGGSIATLTNAGLISGGTGGSGLTEVGLNNTGTIGQLSNESGGTIIGGVTGIFNGNSVGTLTNSGLIKGNDYGIANFAGTIDTLTNTADGTITGDTGISNYAGGSIGTINNMGLITGETGVDNEDVITEFNNIGIISGIFDGIFNTSLIQTLTNGGVITSGTGNFAAIDNIYGGSIGTLTNAGTIAGAATGIENDSSSIATLTNQTGGIISGGTFAISNIDGGSIATLTNAGTIIGGRYGIYNSGNSTIGTLTNEAGGTISGGSVGIKTSGAIGQLTNSGTIDGRDAIQNLGLIGTLNNTGLINGSGTSAFGIQNDAAISELTNSGTISANKTAIENIGTIATLTNAGLITGGNYGIENYYYTIGQLSNQTGATITGGQTGILNDHGVIATLTNSGMITGGVNGIYNDGGSIGQLINTGSGSISSVNNTGLIGGTAATAISNAGSIGNLTNSGTITGTNIAIYSTGTITTLTNSGTISGTGGDGVSNTGSISLLQNALGGSISGAVNGIYNGTGNIGTLTNAGMITGIINNTSDGIENASTISLLANEMGGTISGVSAGIYNAGNIGTLTNAGLFTGTRGIHNDGSGTINLLTNTGTILGNGTGIYNTGSIATLTNAGLISGSKSNFVSAGIKNGAAGIIATLTNTASHTIIALGTGIQNDGLINTLTNAGLIQGIAPLGLHNTGTIGQLINEQGGTIFGNSKATYNQGVIGTLTNAGLIQGGTDDGIYNPQATIAQLINLAGGTIIGGETGIRNDISLYGATIGTLTNSGLITGGKDGIYNYFSTIGELTNNTGGTISGNTGIENQGSIGTLTNAGLITSNGDSIYNESDATIGTLTNTGTIIGPNTQIQNAGFIGQLNNEDIINRTGGGYAIDNAGGTIVALSNGLTSTAFIGAILNFSAIGQITNGKAGTIFGNDTATYNQGAIGTLTNAGLIQGGSLAGIRNYKATIGQLINLAGGTISGGYAAIYDSAFIATLTNAGLMTGGDGIYTDSTGTIGTLTNTGTVAGTADPIFNQGSIGQLDNEGTIVNTDNGYAIFNSGALDELSNGLTGNAFIGAIINQGEIGQFINGGGGTISGGKTATENDGLIGTLSNAGLIEGGTYFGVSNYGIITQLANQAGGTITAGDSAIYNDGGNLGTLTNNGLISGIKGIFNNGGIIGALNNNQGGTIIASFTGTGSAISSAGGGLGTLTNSGLISGNVFVDDQELNIIGGTGSIFGTLTGGSITLTRGENLNFLAGNEILTDNVSTVPSEESIISTNHVPPGTLTNSGTLQIGYPGAPATISVDSNFAQTSAGTLNVIVTPAASSEMIITGTAALSGGVDYVFAPGTYSPKSYAYLTAGSITGTFTSENYNGAPDASTTIAGDPTVSLVLGSSFTFPLIVNPSDSSIFSDQTQALAEATQASDASLLGMAATGGAAASPACEGQAALNPGATNGNNANIASAIAAELCNHGGWIQADGALGHVDGNAGAAGYNANTAGFLAGIDSLFGPAGTRLGFAIGYDQTYLSDKSGGSGDMGTTRVALYGAQPLGPVLLSAVIGYGHAGNDTTRSTAVGGIKENNDLGIVSGAVQASTALALQNFALIPSLGIRFVNVEAASFTEAPNQNNAFAVTGRTKNFNSVQPYATVQLTTSYLTPSGMSIAPQATLGFQEDAGNLGAATNLYAADGTYFASTHTATAPLAAILGAGLAASKSNLSFYINYNGLIAANWNTQSGTAGLRINF